MLMLQNVYLRLYLLESLAVKHGGGGREVSTSPTLPPAAAAGTYSPGLQQDASFQT